MYMKKAEILKLNNQIISQKTVDILATHKCIDFMSYIQNGKIDFILMDGQKIQVTVEGR